jgi:fibronectin-binding autotransporter adhesin
MTEINASGTSGDWTDTSIWSPAQVPGAADDVVIANTGTTDIEIAQAESVAAKTVTLDNPAATLTIDGTLSVGADLTLSAGNVVDNGTLADATVVADGGSFSFGTGTLDGVTWQGALDVGGSGTAVITNGLTAQGADGTGPGSIAIDGDNAQLLFVDAAATLDNATVTIGSDGGVDALNANGTLTLGAGAVVQTASASDANSLGGTGSIVNDGTILASGASGELDIETQNFTNNGAITVTGGQMLAIEPLGSFDNAAGGSITIGDGSTAAIEFLDSFTNEGSIEIASGGELDLDTAASAFTTTQTAGGTVQIDGVLNADGQTLTIAPDSAFSAVTDNGTLIDATVVADGGSFGFGVGTLDGVTWQGNLEVGGSGTAAITGGLTAQGADGTGPGTITVDGPNAQLLFVDAAATLDNATVTLGSNGGLDALNANGTLTLGTGAVVQTASASDVNSLGGTGSIVNDGSILASGASGELDIETQNFTDNGAITATGGQTLAIEPFGTFDNAATGTITVGNGSTAVIEFLDTFTNEGSIEINGGGELDLDTAASAFTTTQASGGTVEIDGLLNADGQTLTVAPDSAFSTVLDFGTLANATVVDNGGSFSFGFGLLDNVTWQGVLEVGGLSTAEIQGTFAAQSLDGTGPGSIVIDGADSQVLFNDATDTLDNATVTIGSNAGLDALNAGGTLTLGAHAIVQAAATSDVDTLGGNGSIINDGTILANAAAGEFDIEPANFTNNGAITVSGGMSLDIQPFGSFDNAATGTLTVGDGSTAAIQFLTNFTNEGVIDIAAGGELDLDTFASALTNVQAASGTVQIDGVLNADGETLSIAADNAFGAVTDNGTLVNATVAMTTGSFGFGVGTLDDVTWQGKLDVGGGGTAVVTGTFAAEGAGGTGPGTITVDGPNAQLLFVDAAATLDNATVTLGSNGGLDALNANGTLTLGTGAVVQTASASDVNSLGGTGSIVNDGTILASGVSGELDIETQNFTNNGAISATGGQTLAIEPFGTFDNAASGSITVGDGSTAAIEFLDSFTNEGTITIASGGELDLDTAASAFTTTQTAGGTVQIDGVLNADGQTLTIAPDSAFATVVDNGTLIDATVIANGGSFGFGTGTLDGVTWQGALDVNGTAAITGTFAAESADGTGPGTITVDGANAQLLFVDAAATLDNTAVTLGSNGGLDALNANGTLTLGAGAVVQTAAASDVDSLGGTGSIVNDGTILASGASGELDIETQNFTNNGAITATGGQTLAIEPFGTFDNAASGTITVGDGSMAAIEFLDSFTNEGTIIVASGGELDLDTAASAFVTTQTAGGTVQIDGVLNADGQTLTIAPDSAFSAVTDNGTLIDATVVADGGSFGFGVGTLDGVTWQGNLEVGGGGTAVITGGLTAQGAGGTGPGTITVDGPNAQLLFVDAAATLDSATVTLGSNGGLDALNANGTLTLGTGAVVQTAAASDVDSLGGTGSIINDGTILASGPSGELDIETQNFTNNGAISVTGGQTLGIEPFGTFDNAASGTITVGGGSTAAIEFLDSFTNEGSITIASGGELDLDTAASAFVTTQTAGGTVQIDGVLNADGQTLTIAPDSAFSAVTDNGTLIDATVVADGGSFGFGVGTLDGVTWQGNLDISGGGTAVITGGLTAQGAGGTGPGTITVDGANAQLLFVDTAATLDNATVTLGSNGGLDALNANGTLTFGTGAVIQTAAASDVDSLGGTGSIVNDGTILASGASGELDIETQNFTNNGSITATGGQALAIEPFGTFDNAASGSITVGDGSTAAIEFLDSFTNEGSITIASGGELDLDTAASAFVTTQTAGGTVQIDGVLNADGQTLTIGPDSAFSTVTDNGTLIDATVIANGGAFDFGVGTLDGVTWQGALDVSGGGTAAITGAFAAEGADGTGPGAITVDGPNAQLLFIDAAATLDNATVTLGSNGGVDALNANGTLTLGTGAVIQTAAASDVDSLGGTGSIVNDGTILASGPSGELDIETQTFTNNGAISATGGQTLAIEPFVSFTNVGSLTVGTGSSAFIQFFDSFTNAGQITVTGGLLDDNATNTTGTGTIQISTGGTAEFDQSVAATQTVSFLDATGTLDLADPAAFLATITGFQHGDTIDVAGVAGDTESFANGVLTFANDGTPVANLTIAGALTAADFTYVADGTGGIDVGVACYCPGTLIRTETGDRPVETLAIGDQIVTVAGALRPIRWIGRRAYAGRFLAGQTHLLPIRIRAGALADGVPQRDLLVSPLHAMALDGVLVPANALVNGTSIVQETEIERVDYIHIELANHDLIWAEGAASETFVDDDSRAMFHNAAEYRTLYPDAVEAPAIYCAPRLVDGHQVQAIRARIAARAGMAAPAALLGGLQGFVEVVSANSIRGWALDAAHPEAPVCLDVLVDGAIVAQVLASAYRPDLKQAGLGSGRHAFAVTLPTALPRALWRRVEVRRSADGVVLPRLPARRRAA